ncbi:hypothetical protein AcW1_003047 [Taiwanofungus camphoratus]|nr:hypothetical protein AcW1_003047 [Antrodia cinnamomea]
MSIAASSTPSLTPSRDPTPEPPIQPDHFYGAENQQLPPSPDSDGRTWLTPEDDPLAQRGIPVFKPTMEEFKDFEAYMNKIERWGKKSGIVKVIPPKEWTDVLPSTIEQLAKVKLKNPIEQHMLGRGGLFRQENVEKRRIMSVREWVELCAKDELRAPGVDDIGLHARATNGSVRTRTRRSRRKARESENAEPDTDAQGNEIKEEEEEMEGHLRDDRGSTALASPPNSVGAPATPAPVDHSAAPENVPAGGDLNTSVPDDPSRRQSPVDEVKQEEEGSEEKPKAKGRRVAQSRQVREAHLAERAAKDKEFLESFDPHSDWLPPNTTPFDYTPEFCRELERRYWRNCGLGRPAWYGADMQGSLFTEETKSWNVANLHSALSRLLPASSQGLPGVNTPYLYFGMWRATFAWHVEDMDLFSINYVHFGAPKYWYAVPQARATALEQTMRGYFPKDVSNCSQFLRHKSFLASPTLLSQSSCRPNTLVQRAGEFVITFPMGYHAGFNLGLNCAESVNFALETWLDIGRKAKACGCVSDSVRIDIDQLQRDREVEREQAAAEARPQKSRRIKSEFGEAKSSQKRKAEGDMSAKAKKQKTSKSAKGGNSTAEASSSKPAKPTASKVTLKLGPKPKEPEVFPCCLCVSMSQEKLLRVQDPPLWRKEGESVPGADDKGAVWMAHEECANVVPETWVDEIEVGEVREDGTRAKERVVFGVDGIVKDRWNLKCTACTKNRHRAHGAPIQCTKGKCPKAFHVSCAREGRSIGIVYNILREVEKEVVLLDPQGTSAVSDSSNESAVTAACDGQGRLMDVDTATQSTSVPTANGVDSVGPRVLKLIRKVEVQVLCSQHNPAIAEAKRAMKQDKIRNELVALPPMSRIKLRVSAGVFEVSLIRVIEESKSVEVLWDRGVKREFKWGSVVFGSTEGVTVGQKPTEPAVEPDQLVPAPPPHRSRLSFPPLTSTPSIELRQQVIVPTSTPPVPTPSVQSSLTPSSSAVPAHHPPPAYPPTTSTYHYTPGAWRYQYPTHNPVPQYGASGSSTQGYQYPGYGHPQYQNMPYPHYGYNYAAHQTPARELQWQRPYTGPKNVTNPPTTATGGTAPYYGYSPGMGVTASANVSQPWTSGHAVSTSTGTIPPPQASSSTVLSP